MNPKTLRCVCVCERESLAYVNCWLGIIEMHEKAFCHSLNMSLKSKEVRQGRGTRSKARKKGMRKETILPDRAACRSLVLYKPPEPSRLQARPSW